eukprot:TRINITY_DN11870_c0_g1_i1.p1 TRINITY_DN11870_c0_g1~~TRINITY_DN11870_c0_g1_i1.p1  ORF type:complete len:353 (+),score=45.76 TRINITY_DN11870_c0_g1_i1:215-1273(+)
MYATEIYHLATNINVHCWNADKTQVALCPNNNEIRIFVKKESEFCLEYVLTAHEDLVTGLDWAPKTNKILSCSQDRNTYIWRPSRFTWTPALAYAPVAFTRGATYCKWSPKEDKFVVTNAAKIACVCYEDPSAFILSKPIRKHVSTVLDAAWHPNNIILATAGSDARCKIVSGFINMFDKKADINVVSFGDRLPFGTLVKDYEARGWIHCVKWSPSGTHLAYASHDSTLTLVDVTMQDHVVHTVRYSHLPLLDLLWINDRSIVGVGYDCTPLLFQKQDAGWTFVTSLDEHFQQGIEEINNHELRTTHRNCITCIQAVTSTPDAGASFSTSGLDGYLVIWHVEALETLLDIRF